MKRNTMFKSLLALVLVLALGSGTMLARQTLAQGSLGITGAASTLSASLGAGFTYQGRLSDASGPVDGTCDLTFKLYDEAGTGTPPTGGTLLGTVTKLSEEVSDGYFTVQLDFGDSAFTGDARWLEIAVDCGGGATTLSPRQELTAAPYARYAAVAPWSGLNGVPAGFADNTDNTDDTVAWSEISGIVGSGASQVAAGAHNHDDRYYTETELQTDAAASVHWGNLTNVPTGFADDTDNTDDTVSWGEISGIVGSGASQVAAGAHNHDGVYAPTVHDHWGETWSGTGTGLTLSGGSTGLYASGSAYGVRASGNTADLRLDGDSGIIYAKGEQQSDLKLYSNSDVDIHLDDDGYTSNAHFRILNDTDTAVFTVNESGAVSWQAQTGYVSIPAAAFGPQEDHYDFTNFGGQLRNNDGDSDRYYAPVQLPHGATVTKMTWYWYDTSATQNGAAYLRRGHLTGSLHNVMAQVDTSGSGGSGSGNDPSISYATIDNSQYTYYVAWLLWDSGIRGYSVVIEYTYTGPY